MSKIEDFLKLAYNSDKELVHVDSVPNGNACGCTCPKCGAELCAKNGGTKRVSHFAHRADSDCKGAVETVLHIMAKEILDEEKQLCVPTLSGDSFNVCFDSVEIEPYFNDLKLRPDGVGNYNGLSTWVEFKKSHEVDSEKGQKIKGAKINCIEIDINDCEQDKESLREFLTCQVDKREWIYNDNPLLYQEPQKVTEQLPSYNDSDYTIQYREPDRHYAIDIDGMLKDSRKLSGAEQLHTFYCPNCGDELVYDEGVFSHKIPTQDCSNKEYLIATSARVLLEKWSGHKSFEIILPELHPCSLYRECKLYNLESCTLQVFESRDLKAFGYDGIEAVQEKVKEQRIYIITITSTKHPSAPITIRIQSWCGNIEGARIVTFDVSQEWEIDKLLGNAVVKSKNLHFCGFSKENKEKLTSPMNRLDMLKFSLYRSGKSYADWIYNCSLAGKKEGTSVKELIYNLKNRNDALINGLIHCFRSGVTHCCYCRICEHLRINCGSPSPCICVLYKSKGTPREPLKTPQINCSHFTPIKETFEPYVEPILEL